MMSLLRQILPLTRGKKRTFANRAGRRHRTSLSTRQGLTLVFGVAAFVGLILIIVYYIWYLPMERAMQ